MDHETSDKCTHPPAVHIVRDGEDWGICLSRLAKIVSGIAVTLVTTLLVAAMGFAWQSNATLAKVDDKLDQIDTRFDRFDRRFERFEDKLDRKADR